MKNAYQCATNHHAWLGICALIAAEIGSIQGVQADEIAKVISSVPIIQMVANTQPVCQTSAALVPGPKSGAGALMGAIAGGVVGNAIGNGGGRAAATGLGVVLGAAMGDNIEQPGPAQAIPTQTCVNQTTYENKVMGYNVTYEYAGKQYTIQTQADPGPFIGLSLVPKVSSNNVNALPMGSAMPSVTPQPLPVLQPQQFQQPMTTIVTPAAPVVYPAAYPAYPTYPAYPVYAPYPGYYPSVRLGIGIDPYWGRRHGWRR
jgi:uncharacterized protein YcfJ